MGTWGVEAFENDGAGDWAADLDETGDLSFVEGALDAVLVGGDGCVDSDVAARALAACEVLARLQGRYATRDAYTEAADAWVAKHAICPTTELLDKALLAINQILGNDSELKELWDDSGELGEWQASVAALRERVSPSDGRRGEDHL